MYTYIVLLKGINVGGHKKVPMADLRELLSKLRFNDVKTYIQSGNVILKSTEKNVQKVESTIRDALLNHFGFEVNVLAKTPKDLQRIFNGSPFSDEQKMKSYFMMLHKTPPTDLVKIASEKQYEGEDYFINNDCIYYFCAKGFGKSKFNANLFERKLETFITARNYNTMVKLIALSSENENKQ